MGLDRDLVQSLRDWLATRNDQRDPIPQTGASNAKAAEFFDSRYLAAADHPVFDLTDFTIEAYFHADALPQPGHLLVAHWQKFDPGNRSWLLNAQDTGKLRLFVDPDGATTGNGDLLESTLAFETGKDYYAAVSYDPSNTTSGVTFYLQNLTDGGPLQSETMGHSGYTPYSSSAEVTIGGFLHDGSPHTPFSRGDGLIDEVRISNTVLPRWRLLAATPEPSTILIWSLLAALGVTVGWRRNHRRA